MIVWHAWVLGLLACGCRAWLVLGGWGVGSTISVPPTAIPYAAYGLGVAPIVTAVAQCNHSSLYHLLHASDAHCAFMCVGVMPWPQVLYLPTIKYSDGSVGYVQIDVSLQPERRDVRVVTFEDRHDAMHCLTIMKQVGV